MFSKVRALRLGALAIIGIGAAFAASVAYGGNASSADYEKVEQQLRDQRGLNQQLFQLLVSSAQGALSATGGAGTAPAYCQTATGDVSVETVGTNASSSFGIASSIDCAESASGGGWRIVLRFVVIDAATGRRVTANDGAAMRVIAPNGAEVLARYSQEADSPFLWAATWEVPFDLSLGAGEYRVVITSKNGQVYARVASSSSANL